MTLDDIPPRSRLFVDANTFVYFFTSDPVFGSACARLFERVQMKELDAVTSTHVMTETAHRLMTLEAAKLFGWKSKIANRLKESPSKIQALSKFRDLLERIPKLGAQILPVQVSLIYAAAEISQQFGLLSNDALIVALMQANGVTNLASYDTDFDRVPGITRYGPA